MRKTTPFAIGAVIFIISLYQLFLFKIPSAADAPEIQEAEIRVEDGYIPESLQLSTDNINDYSFCPADYVGEYLQYPAGYKAGCEPCSLCIILRAWGYDVDVTDIYPKYLWKSDYDFVYRYAGSIYSNGITYPPAIASAAQRYLHDNGNVHNATDITGASWTEIEEKYLDKGYPVAVWWTIDGLAPKFNPKKVCDHQEIYTNEHCMVVYKTSDKNVFISDPAQGMRTIGKQYFISIWEQCGNRAVVITQ